MTHEWKKKKVKSNHGKLSTDAIPDLILAKVRGGKKPQNSIRGRLSVTLRPCSMREWLLNVCRQGSVRFQFELTLPAPLWWAFLSGRVLKQTQNPPPPLYTVAVAGGDFQSNQRRGQAEHM